MSSPAFGEMATTFQRKPLQSNIVQRKHSLPECIRDVSLATSFEALELAKNPGEQVNDGIHKIRVATKKLRAIWYLLRSGRTRTLAKRAITRLRNAARMLAAQRDRTVVREVLADLSAGPIGLADPLPEADRERTRLVDLLQTEHETWLEFDPDWSRKTRVFKNLRGTYRHARRSGKSATQNSSDYELRHEWRKWVKYLYYQLAVLEQCGLAGQRKVIDRLDQLGEALGNEHNLYVLRQRMNLQKIPKKDPVFDGLNQDLKKYRRQTKRLAKIIFANRPNRFIKRLQKKDHLFFLQS